MKKSTIIRIIAIIMAVITIAGCIAYFAYDEFSGYEEKFNALHEDMKARINKTTGNILVAIGEDPFFQPEKIQVKYFDDHVVIIESVSTRLLNLRTKMELSRDLSEYMSFKDCGKVWNIILFCIMVLILSYIGTYVMTLGYMGVCYGIYYIAWTLIAAGKAVKRFLSKGNVPQHDE